MYFSLPKVDCRSTKSMIAFLESHSTHGRYGAEGFSINVKIHHLGLNSNQERTAYDMLNIDFVSEIDGAIEAFTARHNGRYSIGFDGRSAGYLVLHNAYYETSEHKSFCRHCGQRNFTRVPPVFTPGSAEAVVASEVLKSRGSWHAETYLGQPAIAALEMPEDDKLALVRRMKVDLKDCSATAACGVCKKDRVNFSIAPRYLRLAGGVNARDVHEMSTSELKTRVELVRDFHRAADAMRADFIDLLEENEVAVRTVMVPTKIHVLTPRVIA